MQRAGVMLLLVATGDALAHPDHGAGGWLSATLSHLLSEPDHLAMILAPLVVVGIVWMARRATRSRNAPQRTRAKK